MKKFLLIYHSPAEEMERYSKMDDEEKKNVMKVWMDWKSNNEGAVVDFGNPVGAHNLVTSSSSEEKSDDVSGYGIIQAADLDGAKEVLKTHPMFTDGGQNNSISLYQIHEMDM